MGLDQLPADEELHHRGGDPHVGGLADVLPRHRVEDLLDLGVDIGAGIRIVRGRVGGDEAAGAGGGRGRSPGR
jgi:hypothetical protein